jgi:hypothetical protein
MGLFQESHHSDVITFGKNVLIAAHEKGQCSGLQREGPPANLQQT